MSSAPRDPTFTPKLVLGLALIGLGLLLALDQVGWPGAWRALSFWPLAPAAFGLARLRQRGWTHLGGHVWLGVALAGTLAQTGREELLNRWWPLFLVWGGLVIVFRGLPWAHPKRSGVNEGERPQPLVAPPPSSCDPESSLPRENHDPLP